ncbi:MAG: hypothetical protein GKR94_29530 [Gammaproteobacteria bacterium]|nr:hypothetical protein [Gammaproteobacteria bacterium]NKC16196.1 hypothetical protein [Gammaproteobacteria bacterium]
MPDTHAMHNRRSFAASGAEGAKLIALLDEAATRQLEAIGFYSWFR